MNASIFSLRPKGRLRRSAASFEETEMCKQEQEPIKMKRSMRERIRSRSMGGVLRNHSGGSFSVHTKETDPICNSDDSFNKGPHQEKPKRRGKKNAKSRIGNLFRVKRSGKSRTAQNDEEARDDYDTTSVEITSRMDSQDFTQEDIAEWVREQRWIQINKERVSSNSNTKIKQKELSKKKERKSKESLIDTKETEKPPSFLVVDESIEISSTSLLSTADFEVLPKEISDDREDQSQPSAVKPSKPESQSSRSIKNKENKAQISAAKPSKPESQSSRSIKNKENKAQISTAKPTKPESQSSRSIKSKAQSPAVKIAKPESQSSRSMGSQSSQFDRSASRRKNSQRVKNELDVTDHTSTSAQDEDLHDRQRKALSTMISPTSPANVAAADDTVNPRRRYPSKKHLRRATRHSHSAVRKGCGNIRIDFAGQVSASENARPKGTDACIISEINRLGSVVNIMMKRIAMYEKQTECLVQASLAENQLRNKKLLQESDSNQPMNPNTKHFSPARNALPPQDWIRKLEEKQRGHRRRLMKTKKQLKDLQDNEAMRNRRIIMSYEERLKLRDTNIRKNDGERTKVSLRSRSNRSRSYQSISHRSRSNSTTSNNSRSNHSGCNRSLLSNNKLSSEESSTCDSTRIDMLLDVEDSCHTTSSTLSDRSVTFNPTVNVATTLSRYDMCPREKFSYWAGDGDDDITEEMLTYLSEKWKVRNLVYENEQELSSRGSPKGKEAPPFHLISESIKELLPPTERVGNLGYIYTIGIQD